MKVNGRWMYLYRAVDQYGQVIDVWLSVKRDLAAARTFLTRALTVGVLPAEVTTDRAPVYPRVLDELVPTVVHDTEQYATNRVEADQGRLKARLRPMRGLKTFRSARIIACGHAFIQNIRRGHYEIATEVAVQDRLRVASTSWHSPSDRQPNRFHPATRFDNATAPYFLPPGRLGRLKPIRRPWA